MNNSHWLQTQGKFLYNYHEDCFKYYMSPWRVKVDSNVRCINNNVDPKSTCWFTTSHFIYSNICWHLTVGIKIRTSETSSKIILNRSVGFYDNNLTAMSNASFQPKFRDIYSLQLILKSIWMHAFSVWQQQLN